MITSNYHLKKKNLTKKYFLLFIFYDFVKGLNFRKLSNKYLIICVKEYLPQVSKKSDQKIDFSFLPRLYSF